MSSTQFPRRNGSERPPAAAGSTEWLCEARNALKIALLWNAGHRGGVDEIFGFGAMSDGEIQPPGLIQTIPRNTPRDRCGRRCRVIQHLYAQPKDQADRKDIDRQNPQLPYVGCGQMEEVGNRGLQPRGESSTPCGAEFAPRIF
ncbi:unnamed protein product, partial [Iphiclides podalirius]